MLYRLPESERVCSGICNRPCCSLYETMRCIGRIAFPVFAFLIAEGFIHTRSRYRYFFTLLGFAVISEIPWYMLNGADGTHNVMFTLALGVATLMVLENLLQRSMVLGFLWTLGMAGLASWLGVDYEWRGIIVIVIFLMDMVTLSQIVEVCNFFAHLL
ncbi:TraX family protein [Phocaeicola sp.]|uniref:TraX family protein n=1 Tax=Phocaeicola sp. TaxID=2773926 RepID=UPI003979294F